MTKTIEDITSFIFVGKSLEELSHYDLLIINADWVEEQLSKDIRIMKDKNIIDDNTVFIVCEGHQPNNNRSSANILIEYLNKENIDNKIIISDKYISNPEILKNIDKLVDINSYNRILRIAKDFVARRWFMNESNYNQNLGQGMTYQQNQNTSYVQQPKRKNPVIKIFAIIGGFVVGIIVLAVVIISIVSANSNKLVCKSNEGNITIMYNDNEITGYTASGMSYDLDQQKSYAKQVGVQAYLDEFSTWFETNTTGSCSVKEK